MVLEEAKILSKPIIITDTAAREALVGYSNSKIAENTEEEGIYVKLKEVIKNKEIIFSKVEGEKYNNDKIIKRLVKLFEETI